MKCTKTNLLLISALALSIMAVVIIDSPTITGAAVTMLGESQPYAGLADGAEETFKYDLPDGQICDVSWSLAKDNSYNILDMAPTSQNGISGSANTTVTCNNGFGVACSGFTVTITPDCAEPPGCVEQWTCTEWYPCQINTQFRTCTDANACGTIVNKPAENQPCTPASDGEDNDTPDGDGGSTPPADDDDTDAGTGASDAGDNDTIDVATLNDTMTTGTDDNATNATGTNTTKLPKEDKTTFWLIIGGSAAGGVLMLTLIIGLLLRRKGSSVMRVMQFRRR